MWPFKKKKDKSPLVLLTCQGKGCSRTFEEQEEPGVPDHVKSMLAAKKAHEAGWFAAAGPILCPECAAARNRH